ncbi:hypothetical protein [uncultured Draconibacterium sp.]|uniref:hypothetical protein n=1 Tax=uncultured Draconibacterium sp. TaxID=1573823 RepID=UPI00326050CC
MKYSQEDIEQLGYRVVDTANELLEDNNITSAIALTDWTDGDGNTFKIKITAKRKND